jgi:membrane protein
VFGREAAEGEIMGQLQDLVGEQGAEAIAVALQNASQPSAIGIASLISIAFLLLGASGVFAELQDSLNTVWNVKPKPGRLSRTCGDNKILSIVGWVRRGSDFDDKPLSFEPRRNPPYQDL